VNESLLSLTFPHLRLDDRGVLDLETGFGDELHGAAASKILPSLKFLQHSRFVTPGMLGPVRSINFYGPS
jgi:hypothetical protein